MPIAESASAWSPADAAAFVLGRLTGRPLALFVDFDGTLTPIVATPEAAWLAPSMRRLLSALSARCRLIVISGRALDDLALRVDVPGVILAGSHGYEITGGGIPAPPVADPALTEHLALAAHGLVDRLAHVTGAYGVLVEPKRFAVAIHWRQVEDAAVPLIEAIVDEVALTLGGLVKTYGKRVFELRPALPWDKGRAVLWILRHLGDDLFPVYVGDDVTDLDGLRAVYDQGVGIAVGDTLPSAAASVRLADPDAVGRFLELMIEHLRGS